MDEAMKNGLLAIKKALWLLFTAAVLLALPACGGSGETDSGAPKTVSASGNMAENAAAVQLSEKALLVKVYQCDFGSEEVQSILGSLQLVQ